MTKIKEKKKIKRNYRKRKRMYKKTKIPVALREQVWINKMGKVFDGKCFISWCSNMISVFDFQCGHNIPESKGGKTTIDNLLPICGRCNLSMANNYTIDQWTNTFQAECNQSANSGAEQCMNSVHYSQSNTKKVIEVKPRSWCC